jgi:sodium-dependent dicarboxylate transporter 2/3/5
MLPIALAILSRYEDFLSSQQNHRLAVGLLLSIAYSASIGGMMTLVGTAPNLVFSRVYGMATGVSVGFSQWMMVAVPVGVVMLVLVAVIMMAIFLRDCPTPKGLENIIEEERRRLGSMRYEEKVVLIIFLMTAFLWITRKGISIQGYILQGWSDKLGLGGWVDDGSVAIAMALILFFIPARSEAEEQTTILDDKVFRQLPWPVVVLFGGGFALAFGFSESGLSAHLASQLQGLKGVALPVVVLAVTSAMTMLTELTSNTATTQLVLPILQSASIVLDIKPEFLMVPATLAASCAFMFPVATPPNAIIFGSGKVKVMEMVRVGIIINIMAIGVIALLCSGSLIESSYG